MQNLYSPFFPLVSVRKELLFVSTVQYNYYGYNAYVKNFMFFLYVIPKLVMIRQNSDRFPKHLCYKNVISFPSLWFSHEFYMQRGVVAAEKYVEYPEHP